MNCRSKGSRKWLWWMAAAYFAASCIFGFADVFRVVGITIIIGMIIILLYCTYILPFVNK